MKKTYAPAVLLCAAFFFACETDNSGPAGPDGGKDCLAPVTDCAPWAADGGSDGGSIMCRVPAGCFTMGCNSSIDSFCYPNELPYHVVTVSSFLVDMNEVTMADYNICVNAGSCTHHWDDGACLIYEGLFWAKGNLPDKFRSGGYPAVCVDWYQAAAYCSWAGKRLPTEAEWEKTARGPDGRNYPWGSSPQATCDCDHAVIHTGVDGGNGCGTGYPMNVGSKPAGASPYGANDMVGNVWEWVADWYNAAYYQDSPAVDPTGPDGGVKKSNRGGAYSDTCLSGSLRTSVREMAYPESASSALGFRCAR
jgi:formylglycine-generating enzyme required for sulfatase activity